MSSSGFAAWLSSLKSWHFITTILKETWCLKWHKIKVVTANHLETEGSDREGGWGVEWRNDRMEEGGGGGRGWSNVPAEGTPAGGQILFMETIWPARSEPHQTYTWSSFLSLSLSYCLQTHLLLSLSPFSRFLTFVSFPSLYLCYPIAFSSLFLSLKKNILLINAWQLQGAVLLHFSMATVSLFQRIPFQFW